MTARHSNGCHRPLVITSECHRISGEDCFLIKMHAAAIEDIEETLDRFLIYGQTITSVVVSTPVPPRTLPITD
jgi:Lrp/AsnC family transcriptional regulator, leucine-responsive regulatory protein